MWQLLWRYYRSHSLSSEQYINNFEYGLLPTVVGFGVLAVFFPLWIYSQHENQKIADREEAKLAESSKIEMQGK